MQCHPAIYEYILEEWDIKIHIHLYVYGFVEFDCFHSIIKFKK